MDTMTSQTSSWPDLFEWEWASVLLISHVSAVTRVTNTILNKSSDFLLFKCFFPLDPDVLVGKCFDGCSQVVQQI